MSEIAKKAGIAKGGMYYYFRTKEEVLDALVERQYGGIIASCGALMAGSHGDAISKLALLLRSYRTAQVDATLDVSLHMPQNAAIHQKSLGRILVALSPILAEVLAQGAAEGTFECAYPQEYAEILLSAFTFLLDPGIFSWTREQQGLKLRALADLLEAGLRAKPGSFAFLYAQ